VSSPRYTRARTPTWVYKAVLGSLGTLLVLAVLAGLFLAGGLNALFMPREYRQQLYAHEIAYSARMQAWRQAVDIAKDGLVILLGLILLYLLYRAGMEAIAWLHQRANTIRADDAGALPLIVRGDLLHNPNVTLPATVLLRDGQVAALNTADEAVQLHLVQGEQRVRMVTAATRQAQSGAGVPAAEPEQPQYQVLRSDEMPPALLADEASITAMDMDWERNG